jgi:cytochrome c551/c552
MPTPALTLAWLLAAAGAHAETTDAPALLDAYKCTLCHRSAEASTGPSWHEIAARYRDKPHALATLKAEVRKGRHGAGPWPMPPLPQVPDADAERMVRYILSLRD